MATYLVYGANGYTGELVARVAEARGHRPILAGRSEAPVAALAAELGLDHRVFALDDPAAVDRGLDGAVAVLHCAGPFAHTSRPMADGCLRRRVHYLDITGEISVFESLAARDGEAKGAGVMLLPGCGFDVVPSDCLAAHLKRRLPGATALALGFLSGGRMSRGTATTMIEALPRGGMVRRRGVLTPVPAAYRTRTIDFGGGPRKAVTIPWGDVSTAYHSTGIPDIEVYTALPAHLRVAAWLSRYLTGALGARPVQEFLKSRVRSGDAGPSAEERERGIIFLWGESIDGARRERAVSRLRCGDGYAITVASTLAILKRVLAGEAPPGFQTPSKAYGPDFVLSLPGVTRTDEPIAEK